MARSHEAIALVFEESTLSYAELNAQANRLAHLLIGRGVGPETLVALALPRSIEMVVTLLGILKAGAAYLPLDPEYPVERLAYMLGDARPACVLTSARIAQRLPNDCCPALSISQRRSEQGSAAQSLTQATPAQCTAPAPSTRHTSSTPPVRPVGRKGWLSPTAAIVNACFAMQSAYQLRSADRVLQKTPVGFDVSVWEFFWPLADGATLVIANLRSPRMQPTSGE